VVNRNVVRNAERQPIGEFGPRDCPEAFSWQLLGRIVGYASLCPVLRDSFRQKSRTAVIRPDARGAFVDTAAIGGVVRYVVLVQHPNWLSSTFGLIVNRFCMDMNALEPSSRRGIHGSPAASRRFQLRARKRGGSWSRHLIYRWGLLGQE